VTARFAHVSPELILAGAFAILLVYAYPGYTSSDSAVQLTQARTHQYSDGHPPLMAALWTVVELAVTGPLGMLLIQGSLFLLGTYWILRRHVGARAAAIAAGAILLFPPVLGTMAVIWKDSQMAAFLVAGFALLGSPSRRRRWLGVAAIAVATGLRHNAAVATLPILLVMYAGRPGQRRLARLAVATAIWIGATGAALGTNRLLTQVHEHAWHYSVGPADLVGILANTRKHYTDDDVRQILEGTPLVPKEHFQAHAKHIYDPQLWWFVVNGDQRMFDWPSTEDQRAALSRAWETLVLAHPGAYVLHRFRVFRAMIELGPIANPNVTTAVWEHHLTVSQTDDAEPRSALQRAIGAILRGFATYTPIDRPYIYLVLSLCFLPIARRYRDAFALLASGVLYELTYLPFSPSAEFRYSHWMIAATVLAAVILVVHRARQSRTPA